MIRRPPRSTLFPSTTLFRSALVIYAAKRARQINAYYSQLGEGLLEYVGPLVDTQPQEKPLSIALREINSGLLTHEQRSEEHTSELQSPCNLVCRLLLEKKNT